MSKVFVGVDVSKDTLDISFSFDGSKYDSMTIFNNESSILGFFDYLKNTYKNLLFSSVMKQPQTICMYSKSFYMNIIFLKS